jgi:hypothetical protein
MKINFNSKIRFMSISIQFVWVFNGQKGRFPGAVFLNLDKAEDWIRTNSLTGVLTRYPLECGSYDWALKNGLVSKQLADRATNDFIGSFSSASFEHYHYESGERS